MFEKLGYGSFVFLALFIAAPIHAAPFDYRPYISILHRLAKPGIVIDGIRVTAVDYTALAAEAGQPGSDYSTLLKELSSFNPEILGNREEKMAFWINVYNIAAVKTIADHYPVDSIRSKKIHWLGLPWGRKVITVAGKEYSLGQIENDILLDTFKDLRIHFGINCASVSCVNLASEPYRGGTLIKQLDEQGKHFLADPQKGLRIARQKKVIYLSQVFKFDQKHFDQLGGGALNFIVPYLSPEDQEFIRREKENLTMEYLDYNWKSNDIKNAR
ncbi:MAG: DUF547 domain-containing protein [Deltaproteobacteria bacterium]|nr:DUF547 domain-containing protein [Deltaproteobacteria bacterium]